MARYFWGDISVMLREAGTGEEGGDDGKQATCSRKSKRVGHTGGDQLSTVSLTEN